MRGGIDRAAAQVEATRQQEKIPVVLVDAGDALFTRAQLEPEEVGQEEGKARALAAALKQMGVVAKGVGPLDQVRGEPFLTSLGLPLVRPGSAVDIPVGPERVGVVAGNRLLELSDGAAKSRARGATFVVGLWNGPPAEAERLVQNPGTGLDLLVVAHAASDTEGEDNLLVRAAVPLVRVQSKGRSLLRVDVALAPNGGPLTLLKTREDVEREVKGLDQRVALLTRELRQPGTSEEKRRLLEAKAGEVMDRRARLSSTPPAPAVAGKSTLAVRFIPLEATLPGDPRVQALLRGYDSEVSEGNLAWARAHGKDCPAPHRGEPGYVGNATCQTCHEEAFPVYATTRHAHAYQTLVKAAKQYRVDCIACHVTGYQQAGGVCRVDRVTGREGVGCENCHGPGSLHSVDPTRANIRAAPGKNICVGCHNPENSPAFDFAVYLPKILGKGHAHKQP